MDGKPNLYSQLLVYMCMKAGLVLSRGRLKGDCPIKPSFQQGSRLDHFVMDVTLLGRAADSWVHARRCDSDH